MIKVCKTCGNEFIEQRCGICTKLRRKSYQQNYPERTRLYNDRKRANTPQLTQREKEQVYQIYQIAKYKTEETGIPHHVDHIIPVSKGGLHVLENLRVITAKENLMKSNKYTGETLPQNDVPQQQPEVTDDEIIWLCKTLAGRYKNSSQYEDLISEGLVACYELKAVGNTDKGAYVGAARRAMNDYMNIKVKAVSIPVAFASRTVSHAIANDNEMESLDGVKGGTLASLMSAMTNTTEALTENTGFTRDHAEKYEEDEYNAHVLAVAITTLNQTEWTIIKLRYFDGMTQHMVADRLNTNQKWVSRHETTAIDKLRVTLLKA